ncbi:hypothetical protein HK098_000597 [Nowakowskiella sp. JEL0407]|nr:hypothetical protein HK098_000587 [Nowakowskiella sp. JEL0407]KAJ3125105.1 hypothetical protein HK098_000597 [Nowakowskiella sp. JEL0407]
MKHSLDLNDDVASGSGVTSDVLVKCKECSKPVLASGFQNHLENCLKTHGNKLALTMDSKKIEEKNALKRKREDETPPPITTFATMDSPSLNSLFPVSADGKKKKEKKAEKIKTPKPKAVIDYDKNCGVPTDLGPCTRSITCKIHTMSAKRAVYRSLPYDTLLQGYQARNFGKVKNPIQEKQPLAQLESVPLDVEADIIFEAIRRNKPVPLVASYGHSGFQPQGFLTDGYSGVTGGVRGASCGSLKMWKRHKERLAVLDIVQKWDKV